MVRLIFYPNRSVADSGPALKQIASLADSGAIKPMLDTVLPLAEARRAHELGETSRTRGKIVLAAV